MKTILIVDDDDDHHTILRVLLRHHGYSSLHALSVEEARGILLLVRPDLILLDVWMRTGHGLDLLYSLAVTQRRIPVVVCTADALASLRYPAAVRSAADWIVKPVVFADLCGIIERCTAASHPAEL